MYLRNLYPVPLSFSENEAEAFRFGAKVTARVSGISSNCAERVKILWKRFSCDASDLELIPEYSGVSFRIGNCELSSDNGDYYALKVTPSGVSVTARDQKSLMDGLTTLMQLICPDVLEEGRESLYISEAEIHDSPAVRFRAVHFCIFPDTKLYNIEKAIHLAGFLKMTHVILEFWGTFRYECMPELAWADRSFSKDELRQLVSLAKSYGMEVIPMANQFGHASQSRESCGRHVVLNKNPRLSRLFEPDGWTWCLSNPDTYKVLSEIRNELEEFCGPGSYFHLGFDEAYSFATCDRCRKRVPHELLAEFLNRITEDECKKGRRPIVWHDQFLRRSDFGEGNIVALGDRKNTAAAIDLLDRRIIMADWQYDYRNDFNVTTPVLMDKGFDTVICPFDDRENIRSISYDAKKLNAYGVILTTWHHLPEWLQGAAYSSACLWQPGDCRAVRYVVRTDFACILRRLYDSHGSFEESGWNLNEVIQ